MLSRLEFPILPKGPNGERRPADAIGLAVMIGKIATGEIEDERESLSSAAAEMCRKGGQKRAAKMTPAMAAGVIDRLWSLEEVLARIDADAPTPAKRGPYKKRG